jgi:signal transduction histidine kinase
MTTRGSDMERPRSPKDMERPRSVFEWSLALTLLAIVGVLLVVAVTGAVALVPVWVGVPLTLGALARVRRYADLHRLWAGRRLGEKIPSPYLPVPASAGKLSRLLAAVRDPATWRDLAWLLVNGTAGLALASLAFVLWASIAWHAVLPLLWALVPELRGKLDYAGPFVDGRDRLDYAVVWGIGVLVAWLAWRWSPLLLRANARLVRWLLAPSERATLERRVEHLAASRADTVDAQALELRRIERDLHDGAQAKLVALGMSLGMAEELIDRDPAAARDLLAEARLSTSQALGELRNLVRGIHPPVLADRGLDGAARALALALPLTVDVDATLAGRPQPPVEAAAYFAVVETLTNTVKHAGAGRAWVRLRHEGGRLCIEVGDDGRGGATLTPGGGLRGLERRLDAFDGTLALASPAGGPTIVTMEIPCELSSPKTSPSSETG